MWKKLTKIRGEDGKTPIAGVDFPLPKNGKDGNDAIIDEELIAQKASNLAITEVLKSIPTIEAIEADLPKLGASVRDSLELLNGDERLDKSAVKDLEDIIKSLEDKISNIKTSGGGARMQTVIAEAPTGDVNGVNDTFYLKALPKENSLMLIWNGQFQRPGASFEYTISKKVITFNAGSIPTDGALFAYYCKL